MSGGCEMDEDRGATVCEWEEGVAKVRNSRRQWPRDSKGKCRPKVIADKSCFDFGGIEVEVGSGSAVGGGEAWGHQVPRLSYLYCANYHGDPCVTRNNRRSSMYSTAFRQNRHNRLSHFLFPDKIYI